MVRPFVSPDGIISHVLFNVCRDQKRSPLELREVALCLAKHVSSRFVREIKKNGEYISPKIKSSCRERAMLLLFHLVNLRMLFPAIRQCYAKSDFPIKRNVIKFITKFISLVATGDIASLNKYFRRSPDPESFQRLTLKYAEKCRQMVVKFMPRYTDEKAIKAQRGAVTITLAEELLMREEIKAHILWALFQSAYTYRLCSYVRRRTSNLCSITSIVSHTYSAVFSFFRHKQCHRRPLSICGRSSWLV